MYGPGMRRLLTGIAALLVLLGMAAWDPALAEPTRLAAPPASRMVPVELSTAPAWIGRQFDTGLVPQRHTHKTYTLQRYGRQALLRLETQLAGADGLAIGTWQAQPVKVYLGIAEEKANLVTLKLSNVDDPTDTITLPCRRTAIAVARADAVRRSSIPAAKQECGDRGRWHPASTRQIPALRCLPLADKPWNIEDSSTWDSAPHLAFAPSPGIEWLYVNDDCLQGGGWREVPADRSIVTEVR